MERGRPRVAPTGAVLLLLLGPALAMTAVRLRDPRGSRGIAVEAFTPYALAPYAAVLVVLVLVVWSRTRRGRRRRALLLPAGLALAGLVLHATWAAPLVLGAGRDPEPGARPVVLMSANLFLGRADGAAVVRAVAERDVDVLALVEVTARTVAELDDAGLAALLPYRVGGPREADQGTMVLSRTPVRFLDAVEGTRFGTLLVRTAGLRLLAAHPSSPVDADAWRSDHALLARAVARHGPDVVAGDLNATLDHPPLRRLADAGYRDSVELLDAGLPRTWPANGLYRPLWWAPPLVGIDHVLLAPTWTATATGTVEVAETDHLAVVATVVPAVVPADAEVSGGAP